MLRVLFIAPVAPNLPRLAWHDELAALADIDGVDVTLVAGEVATIANVAKRLTADAWDVIVFSGHGKANCLILSDGRAIPGAWLATQAKARAPEVVLVGACYSAAADDSLHTISQEIADAGLHAIAFEAAVDDLAGAVFATEFIRSMAAVFDVTRAMRVATEMTAQVSLNTAKSARLSRAAVNGWRQFTKRLDGIECTLAEMNDRLRRLEGTP